MRKKLLILSVGLVGIITTVIAQAPWSNKLMIATSSNGTTFNTPQVFQDSSGVPAVIRLSSGILIAAFQWFPAPINSAGWDSVAIKTSTDDGASWSNPISINVTGMPGGMQRPFDPTLVETDSGQIRMFFSSGPPAMGLDSTINTYSAISNDGINYTYESGARFDMLNDRVIDPACTKFNGVWHYTTPRDPVEDGAFHATSADCLTFVQQTDILSDVAHNWTGNLMVDSNEMRFYGCGNTIWWNSTLDGITWNGYTNTNVMMGGDPAVVKLPSGTYIMIYVGISPPSGVEENASLEIQLYPNPSAEKVFIGGMESEYVISVFDLQGKLILVNKNVQSNMVDISGLVNGIYLMEIVDNETGIAIRKKFIKN